MNPMGAIAAKQGGTLGKLLDPAQTIGARSSGMGRAIDPMNLIRPAPPPDASNTLLADK
jgi:hypothetical protein